MRKLVLFALALGLALAFVNYVPAQSKSADDASLILRTCGKPLRDHQHTRSGEVQRELAIGLVKRDGQWRYSLATDTDTDDIFTRRPGRHSLSLASKEMAAAVVARSGGEKVPEGEAPGAAMGVK